MTGHGGAPSASRRLLAVDDNRLILRVISDFFAPRGWSVVTAEDVPAARLELARARPDAIVSDILMPEIDGWAFFDGVRRDPATAGIPFVFLTIESDLPQRLRGLHLGADDYLTKPFAVEELHARLTRLVDRREALASAHRHGEALLSGSVEHLAISDLLQILSLNNKDGTVVLTQGDQEGRIEFVGGRIVHAAVAPVQGAKALFRMLGWASANFRVLPREGMPSAATIAAATANVLMDGLVSLDEWARWKDALPPQRARLMLSPEARARLAGQAVSPVEFDLLARAKTGTTIAEVIESSPHPDASVAEAICKFLSRGILMAVESPEGAGSIASSG
jgi:DNA-binding response OmpR family regulator